MQTIRHFSPEKLVFFIYMFIKALCKTSTLNASNFFENIHLACVSVLCSDRLMNYLD